MTRLTRIASAGLVALALTSTPSRAADTWKIDGAHSSVTFAVTHLMISTVRGGFGAMTGTLEYDGKDLSSIKIDATVDATTIDTNNERRDGHLKGEDFFDVAKYPTITFKSKKATPGASGGTFKLTGDLTMHGVTKEVTFDCTGPSSVIKGSRGESRVGASATAKIKRLEYGIKWNSPLDEGGFVVSDDVAITIDIEAMIPPPPPPAGEQK